MRIAFVTNLTTEESLPVLQRLKINPQVDLVHVFFFNTLSSGRTSLMRVLKQFGWQQLMRKLFSIGQLKLRQWSRRLLPAIQWAPRSAYELARNEQIPHTIVNTLNDKDVQQTLQGLDLDLLLVCVCKNILKRTTIEIPKLGSMNIHPSLLPSYRGPTPVFWTLFEGQNRAGVTFQKMTEQIDVGPIIQQFEIEIDPSQSESQVSRQLFQLAAERLDMVLSNLPSRMLQAESHSAPDTHGKYYGYPSASDRQELKIRQHSRSRSAN